MTRTEKNLKNIAKIITVCLLAAIFIISFAACTGQSDIDDDPVTDNIPTGDPAVPATAIENFASVTKNGGTVEFSWEIVDDVDRVDIVVKVGGGDESKFSISGEKSSWSYSLQEGTCYEFEFTPVMPDGIHGETVACTRYYNPQIASLSFPKVEIATENYVWPTCNYISAPEGCWGQGITNNEYTQCVVSISDGENNEVYLSSADGDYAQAKIKIRGNTSAYSEKKPYKIKLNKKTDLLKPFIPNRGNEFADKEWLLLKAGTDLKQVVGWGVSELVELEFTPAYTYVTLFVNGDYQGLYVLCESVKQGNVSGNNRSRCNVDNDGFVVELDAYWWNEELYFTTPHTKDIPAHYTFKYPDSDNTGADSAEYNYIKDYITDFEYALQESDDSYLQYIDEESFAKWLLCHDIVGTHDSGGSNIYLFKKDGTADSRLSMGVAWDFDSICSSLYLNEYARIRSDGLFYFPQLVLRESFIETYRSLFANVRDSVVQFLSEKIESLDSVSLASLVEIEKERWNDGEIDGFKEQKETILIWIEEHLSWLEGEILN